MNNIKNIIKIINKNKNKQTKLNMSDAHFGTHLFVVVDLWRDHVRGGENLDQNECTSRK